MLDAFLWWSGAIFWSVWIGLLLMALGNVILGSVASGVIARCPQPVLLIR